MDTCPPIPGTIFNQAASIVKLVTCGRYAPAARSRMYTSSKAIWPLNPPKTNIRLSARMLAWYPRFDGGLPRMGRYSYCKETYSAKVRNSIKKKQLCKQSYQDYIAASLKHIQQRCVLPIWRCTIPLALRCEQVVCTSSAVVSRDSILGYLFF